MLFDGVVFMVLLGVLVTTKDARWVGGCVAFGGITVAAAVRYGLARRGESPAT